MTKVQDIWDDSTKGLRELTHDDTSEIRSVLIGRRVVEAHMNRGDEYSEGTLTLDNGVQLLVEGHEGGCACSSGDYYLDNIAAFDHAITNVEVLFDGQEEDYERSGTYRLFVYAEGVPAGQSVAEFTGDDGNGYYGTGFHVYVKAVAA